MPVSIAWGSPERRFLVISFEGRWELEDFHHIIKQHDQMLESVEHKVHILIDIRKSWGLPNGFLGAIRKTGRNPHPKVGKMAMLGMSAFVRAVIEIIRKVQSDAAQRTGMYFADNEEAVHVYFAGLGNPPLLEIPEDLPAIPNPTYGES